MKRLILLMAILALLGPPAMAQRTLYVSPDVPTDDPGGSGITFMPWDVLAYKAGAYTPFPVLSFDVPTSIGAATYDPADLVQYQGGIFTLYFDASTAGLGVATSDNVTGADESYGKPVLAMDVPSDLMPATGPNPLLIGWFADWDGTNFNVFDALANWPLSSEVDALSCQGNPGRVYDRVVYQNPIRLDKPVPFSGPITLSWSPSCSSGAEDYGIYEGTLGSWYSHKKKICSDVGLDFTETFLPQPAASDRCVVPQILTPCP